MFVALVVLNVWHPGQVLVEKESEFLSRKERKREREERKMEEERRNGVVVVDGGRGEKWMRLEIGRSWGGQGYEE